MKTQKPFFKSLLCLWAWVFLVGCEKSVTREDLFMSMYNASDDSLDILITCDQLQGADWRDYTQLVYPQYAKDTLLFSDENGCCVRLWNRPMITRKDAVRFFRQIASTEKDSSFTYWVSGTFASAKND